jgi:flagellar L-ring protein precursor FlgH
MMKKYRTRCCFSLFLLLPLVGLVSACGPKTVSTTAAASLGSYIAEASAQTTPQQTTDGSLWVGQSNHLNLFRDFKAREVNDVVTIVVSETTQANSAADATSNRASSAQVGISNLFGAEKRIKELSNAVDGKSTTTFKGTGSTTRATALTTTVTARVKSVLPNGYLVIEGVRELRLNNENQIIYLTGVLRPEDISAHNEVASAAIAQMEIRVQGKGVVSQPLKPGILYRILNGIFPF